ncbi:MAG TPA: hypothetical protein VNT79_03620 [Phycisphaerae bacterium]|nr:hypothetical protein [Phycisphaerae bacterium]
MSTAAPILMEPRFLPDPGARSLPMSTVQSTKDYYRYCPGEEHVKISNAICRGRRRSNFPKCTGCQFNDDQRGGDPHNYVQAQVAPPETIRVSNGQVVEKVNDATKIGTLFKLSDISGVYPYPLSDDAAWRIGHAAAQYLRSKLRGFDRADPIARSVVVGRDTRGHSLPLEDALIEGMRSTGTDVITLGEVGTPHLYYVVNHLGACGGVQVTSGNGPINQNGFRICGPKATPIGMDTGLSSIRDIAIRVPRHFTGASSRRITKDFSELYCKHIRAFVRTDMRLPEPIGIVVDASNGTAAKWLPLIFRGNRNVRLVRVNFENKGEFDHEPNPLLAKNTRDLRTLVRTEKAAFGIGFDSSEERCVFIDDKGRTIRPDHMIALLACAMLERDSAAQIIFDHRASSIVDEEIVRAGGIPVRERIGAAYMKRTMAERDAAFGGDLSGRFYFRSAAFCESAVIAMIQVINLLINSGKPLSELTKPLQRYSVSGEIKYLCPDTHEALRNLSNVHRSATIEHLDGLTFRYPDWWFNVRPNPAERSIQLTLEAKNRKLVDERLEELSPLLGSRA